MATKQTNIKTIRTPDGELIAVINYQHEYKQNGKTALYLNDRIVAIVDDKFMGNEL